MNILLVKQRPPLSFIGLIWEFKLSTHSYTRATLTRFCMLCVCFFLSVSEFIRVFFFSFRCILTPWLLKQKHTIGMFISLVWLSLRWKILLASARWIVSPHSVSPFFIHEIFAFTYDFITILTFFFVFIFLVVLICSRWRRQFHPTKYVDLFKFPNASLASN